MSKEKTPVQFGIDRKKEMLELLIEQRKHHPPGNPKNEFDIITAQIEIIRKVIHLDESIRDNQEREALKSAFNQGYEECENSGTSIMLDPRPISECSNSDDWYNEKYGRDGNSNDN